jgi:DAK2 domain fusion protein YloV
MADSTSTQPSSDSTPPPDFDVPTLHAAVQTAEGWLRANREAVNAINVYPVPDGDTGTNMLLTLQAAIENVDPSGQSIGDYLDQLARGALLGARGNSGVIFSQALRGIANEMAGHDTVDGMVIAAALQQGFEHAYSAVPAPAEGTMLTVMRDGAHAAQATPEDSPLRVLGRYTTEAQASVQRTPDLMPMLRDAGVVDAGGLGIALLFQGLTHGITGDPLPEPMVVGDGPNVDALGHEGYGYCTEFVVVSQGEIDRPALTRALTALGGDSVLVVGESDAVHVHVHVEDPGPAISAGAALGSLRSVKVDDMQAQHDEWRSPGNGVSAGGQAGSTASDEVPAVGLVVVARGEGVVAAFRELGATRVIEGGPTGKASAGELLEAIAASGSDHVIVLPNDKDVLLAAEQAANNASVTVTVVPSRSFVAGLAAVLAYQPDGDAGDIAERMRESMDDVRCVEVTYSVREALVEGIPLQPGDGMALVDGKLVEARENLEDALLAGLTHARTEDSSLITLYLGAEAESDSDALQHLIERAHPDLELEVVHGGQPTIWYTLSVE